MPDLVNATAKSQLAQRDSEPTHLKGGSYDDLGGTRIDSEPNSVKIDAGKGVKGQDTSVKGAGQLSEPSHLKTEDDKGVDVKFDGDDEADTDDLDKELDKFEEVELDIKSDKDDDDEKKDKVKEDVEGAEQRGDAESDMEKSAKEPEAAMNSGPNKVTEDLPPWLKKDGDDDKETVKEDEEIVIKQAGDDDKKDDKKDDDKGEKKENPFAKKDDKKVEEALKIRIKLPKTNLFESVVSEKNQKQVGVIFESAIKDVAKQISKQAATHYRKLHEAKLAKRDVAMAKQVDSYLSYVVEEWTKVNKVAIRQSLRSQLAEEFLNGLRTLFKEHYIDVPESKVDVVKQLTAQVGDLKKNLNEQHAKTVKLHKLAEAANKARIVSDFVHKSKLSEAASAKFKTLAEDVAYSNAKDFREKLSMLKESYFGNEKAVIKEEKRLPAEDVQAESKKTAKSSGDADVDAVVNTISRQANAEKW